MIYDSIVHVVHNFGVVHTYMLVWVITMFCFSVIFSILKEGLFFLQRSPSVPFATLFMLFSLNFSSQ